MSILASLFSGLVFGLGLIVSGMADPAKVARCMKLQSIAKHLERIGDHATNLAEMVVFMVRGKDIRHAGRMQGGAPRLAPLTVLPGRAVEASAALPLRDKKDEGAR